MNKRLQITLLILLPPLLLLAVLAAFAETSGEKAKAGETAASDSIWVITDVHFLSGRLRDESPYFTAFIQEGDGKNLLIQDELTTGLLEEIKRERPAALLVTGDMTFNGEKKSHKDFAKYLGRIEALGTEVYVIPGNHDIQNPWARSFKGGRASSVPSVTPREFRSIYSDYGFDRALTEDKGSLSYLAEPVPGLQILMLDSCIYDNNYTYGIPWTGGRLSDETRQWIESAAAPGREEGKKIIAALHHSLLEHNPVVSDGFTIDDNTALADFFASLEIRSFLSGHIHVQDIIEKETAWGTVRDISTNALSVFPHNTGRLEREGGSWIYSVRSLAESDSFTESFRQEAEGFFRESSNRLIWKTLGESSFSPGELDLMAELFASANLNFFAGREADNTRDIDPEILRLFRTLKNSFLDSYLQSILNDSSPGDRKTEI